MCRVCLLNFLTGPCTEILKVIQLVICIYTEVFNNMFVLYSLRTAVCRCNNLLQTRFGPAICNRTCCFLCNPNMSFMIFYSYRCSLVQNTSTIYVTSEKQIGLPANTKTRTLSTFHNNYYNTSGVPSEKVKYLYNQYMAIQHKIYLWVGIAGTMIKIVFN